MECPNLTQLELRRDQCEIVGIRCWHSLCVTLGQNAKRYKLESLEAIKSKCMQQKHECWKIQAEKRKINQTGFFSQGMWSYMLKLLSSTDFLKVCGIQQFLSKQTKQIMQVPHDCVQGSAGCPCFLKPSVTDQLLKTFELKSHFPAQVRFNVNVPSCARGTAECERLIYLPAQQL